MRGGAATSGTVEYGFHSVSCPCQQVPLGIQLMFRRLGQFIAQYWWAVILLWMIVAGLIVATAPRWNDITYDGEFAYLPDNLPSVIGQRRLNEAFPDRLAKSQFVVALARDHEKLDVADIHIGYDIARRLHNLQGEIALARAEELLEKSRIQQAADDLWTSEEFHEQAEEWLANANTAFGHAVIFDDLLSEYWSADSRADAIPAAANPLPAIHWNRNRIGRHLGYLHEAGAARDRAKKLDPNIADQMANVVPPDLPLLDVWTWRDSLVGKKLISDDECARLIVLHLSNEFIAVDNMAALGVLEEHVNLVRGYADQATRPGLQIVISGSAAVGTDMLRSSADSIRSTEIVTVLLIISFLVIVYRSPILVIIPLVAIGVSFVTATALIAHLTQLNQYSLFSWWDLKVFTTSKVFIIVILFGAGTDYCLFLISRYREELSTGKSNRQAMEDTLSGVGDALAASALTTVVGLLMMYFARFGKFHYSGPIIGLALMVTLLACLTLAPALLCATARAVTWNRPQNAAKRQSYSIRFWDATAQLVARAPWRVLMVVTLLMLPAAVHGWWNESRVSYDILSALSHRRPSKIGSEILRKHFPVGESGPIVVVAYKQEADFDSQMGRNAIRELARAMAVENVTGVRCVTDPLGVIGNERISLLTMESWTTRLAREHPRVKSLFISQTGPLAKQVTQLEVVLSSDPFSSESMQSLSRLEEALQEYTTTAPYWRDVEFSFAGTTASMRDLRSVTRSDHVRIQILVVVAVFFVLLLILRRPFVCSYMIITVLFSYFVALGVTIWFFGLVVGDGYQGLDWKVPLFLFVILVAIGQDYNVYLTTRVFEEQRRLGPVAGLRNAIVTTGGIITSCGLIMAATFVSMTCAALFEVLASWFPVLFPYLPTTGGSLLGITQLGFALAVGVVIDTLIVRSIMVPALLSLMCRYDWRSAISHGDPKDRSRNK